MHGLLANRGSIICVYVHIFRRHKQANCYAKYHVINMPAVIWDFADVYRCVCVLGNPRTGISAINKHWTAKTLRAVFVNEAPGAGIGDAGKRDFMYIYIYIYMRAHTDARARAHTHSHLLREWNHVVHFEGGWFKEVPKIPLLSVTWTVCWYREVVDL